MSRSLHQGDQDIILIAVYFRRLKINHDVYEFKLDSGTIANSKYVCHAAGGRRDMVFGPLQICTAITWVKTEIDRTFVH